MRHSITSSTHVNKKDVSNPTVITPIEDDQDTISELSPKARRKDWFPIYNALVDNFTLSNQAIFLLIFIIRQSPTKFVLRDSYLRRRMDCQQKKLERLIRELRQAGYVRNVSIPGENGKFSGSKRIFSDIPEFLKTESMDSIRLEETDPCNLHYSEETDPCKNRLVDKCTTVNKKTKLLQTLKKTNVEPARPASIDQQNILKVFKHWQKVMGHPGAKLDDKRKAFIAKALKLYPIETCLKAIDGCWKTPHNMGDNDRGGIYDAVGVIFKSADNIERFAQSADRPPIMRLRSEHWRDENAKQNVDFFEGGESFWKTPNSDQRGLK